MLETPSRSPHKMIERKDSSMGKRVSRTIHI